jgi:SMI1/KNR4 family protein SUKH-1
MDETELIAAIRARIADPDRRVDARPSEFFASVQGMSLGSLFRAGRAAAADAIRAARGDLNDELIGKAEGHRAAMNRPAERPLPARATPEALEAAEARMGVAIPPLLRRLYAEVANGGFGPGSGIIGIQGGWTDDNGRTIEDLLEMMSEGDPDERSWRWPVGLVPIVDYSPVWTCVATAVPGGRVVDFDHEEIEYGGWDASFSDVAPSLHDWLVTWVGSRPAHQVQREEMVEQTATSDVETARQAREAIGRMSIEERRAMGLPDVGWEQVVWGGIGLEPDEDPN